MSIDDGDEMGRELLKHFIQAGEKVLNVIYRGIMASRGSSENDLQRQDNISAAVAEIEADAEPDALVSETGVEYRKLLVPTDLEARYMLERLSNEHVEWYTHPDDIDRAVQGEETVAPCYNSAEQDPSEAVEAMLAEGAYRTKDGMVPIYVPMRDAKLSVHAPFSKDEHTILTEVKGMRAARDFDEETMGLIEVYDHESIRAQAKLARAYAANAELIPEIEFNPDLDTNFALEFKTVSWDAEASYLSSRLDRAGIPHAIEPIAGQDAVNVVIDPRHATPLRELLDAEINVKQVKGMTAERFPNFDELKELSVEPGSKARIYQATLENPGVAEIVEEMLQEQGIAYDIDIDPDTQAPVLTVPETELADLGYTVPMMQGAINRVASNPNSLSAKSEQRARRQKPDAQRRHSTQRLGKEAYPPEKRTNPTKDGILAAKSEEAQRKRAAEINKNQNRSK